MGMAYAHSEAGQHDEAIAAVNKLFPPGQAVPPDEFGFRALAFLASEYEQAGKAADGAVRFRELLLGRPADERTAELLILLEDRAGKVDQAVAAGRAFLAQNPEAHRLRLVMAGLLEKANRRRSGLETGQ